MTSFERRVQRLREGYNKKIDVIGQDDPLDDMTLDQLKAYAKEHQIDIGNATSESGIRKKITESKPNGCLFL